MKKFQEEMNQKYKVGETMGVVERAFYKVFYGLKNKYYYCSGGPGTACK